MKHESDLTEADINAQDIAAEGAFYQRELEQEIQASERMHTPGPWQVGHGQGELHLTDHSRIFMPGPSSAAIYSMGSLQESYANAHLIAAAPELLEACKEVETDLLAFNVVDVAVLSVERVSELRGMLLAAIAKAEGK